jgi:hypothetical protein
VRSHEVGPACLEPPRGRLDPRLPSGSSTRCSPPARSQGRPARPGSAGIPSPGSPVQAAPPARGFLLLSRDDSGGDADRSRGARPVPCASARALPASPRTTTPTPAAAIPGSTPITASDPPASAADAPPDAPAPAAGDEAAESRSPSPASSESRARPAQGAAAATSTEATQRRRENDPPPLLTLPIKKKPRHEPPQPNFRHPQGWHAVLPLDRDLLASAAAPDRRPRCCAAVVAYLLAVLDVGGHRRIQARDCALALSMTLVCAGRRL